MTPATLEAIRDQVKGVLGTAEGISATNVLDIEAWSEDPEWIRDHFVEPSGRLCGWWVETRTLPWEERLGWKREVLEFTLRGVLGYQDAVRSRAEAEGMQTAVFAVIGAASNRRLGSLVTFTNVPAPPARVRPFWVEAGDGQVLCHFMEVVFTAEVDVANA